MSEVAKRAGVNRENLYRSLSGKGNPEYATVAKVIRALDLKMIPGMKAAA
jgi:probable addiction module antidote protein